MQQLRKASHHPHSWQKDFSDEELEIQIENIKKIGQRLKASCLEHHYPYFESLTDINELMEEVESCFFSANAFPFLS